MYVNNTIIELFLNLALFMICFFLGFCAVIMRQTNILWILMFFGQYVLKELFLHSDLKQTKRIIHNNFSLKVILSTCVVQCYITYYIF